MSENILVAKDTFVTVVDGERVTVKKGKTRVAEGHPLHRAAPSMFKPVDVTFGVETARNEPPAPPAGSGTPPAPPAADPAPADPAPAKKAAAKKAAAADKGKE